MLFEDIEILSGKKKKEEWQGKFDQFYNQIF